MRTLPGRVFAIGLLLVLGAGLLVWWGRQPFRSPAANPARAATAIAPDPTATAGAERGRRGNSPSPAAAGRTAGADMPDSSPPSADSALRRLRELRPSAREPLALRQALVEFERLRQAGAAALPAIRAFLGSGQDADYDAGGVKIPRESRMPADFLIPPSLRLGLLEVVKNIGGPEAERLLVEELRTSGRGVEVAYLAGALQQLRGDAHRETAVTAARDLLAMPLTTRATNPLDRADREYLYGVLSAAGDNGYATEARKQLLLPDGRVDRGALGYLQNVLREEAVTVAAQAWRDPRIPPAEKEPLARVALAYVGASAPADDLYRLALQEPALTDSQRQNLIEDLNQTGFPNLKQLTAADLRLIDRRLALIEQLAPQLRDRTSTAALGEAKKDLLNMRDRILHPPPPKK